MSITRIHSEGSIRILVKHLKDKTKEYHPQIFEHKEWYPIKGEPFADTQALAEELLIQHFYKPPEDEKIYEGDFIYTIPRD